MSVEFLDTLVAVSMQRRELEGKEKRAKMTKSSFMNFWRVTYGPEVSSISFRKLPGNILSSGLNPRFRAEGVLEAILKVNPHLCGCFSH